MLSPHVSFHVRRCCEDASLAALAGIGAWCVAVVATGRSWYLGPLFCHGSGTRGRRFTSWVA